ncbi:MAG: DNA-protecting protein DprA [Thermodesulfobacteria bacterium]|nr:DNA-protecting protein DprA [Thermodesulfobacteriota bacterium]
MFDRKLLLALSLVPGLGPLTIQKIVNALDDLRDLWALSREDLKTLGLRKPLPSLEEVLRRAEEEISGLERLKASYVTFWDEDYPPLLKEIATPPPVLFYQGSLPRQEALLAVVGSRAATSYGLSVTKEWVAVFVRHGLGIVSGFALGIDGAAHRTAVREGGRTYGVLGCGLDVDYPAAHRHLRQEILEAGGGFLTEFPLGTEPRAGNFPVRNRLISGLSQAVLVVEASPKSGSLITARLAAEQGREVLAVPGPVYSLRSHGCHQLLREGAALADKPEDVLSSFGQEPKAFLQPELTLGPEEAKVLEHLSGSPLSIDELVYLSGLSTMDVTRVLAELELEGLIERLPGNFYRRVRR